MAQFPRSPLSKPYPAIPQQLRTIDPSQFPDPCFEGPYDAASAKLHCSCGTSYDPPWHEKLETEFADYAGTDGGIYTPAGVEIACPKCSKMNVLSFPKASQDTQSMIHLIGDESYHLHHDGNTFYTYCFVSFIHGLASAVEEKLLEIKRILRPDFNPEEWSIHAQELRTLEWRAKNGVKFETYQINEFLLEVIDVVASVPGERYLFVAFGDNQQPKNLPKKHRINRARDHILTCALFGITHHLTSHGFNLQFFLENQTNAFRSNQIDSYVEKIGRGLRFDLSYLWSCHQKTVGLPITLSKGSRFELEIADLLAFSANRFFRMRALGRASEIPIKRFGPIQWGVRGKDYFNVLESTGFNYRPR